MTATTIPMIAMAVIAILMILRYGYLEAMIQRRQDYLEERLAKLAENLAALKKELEEQPPVDTVEQQIAEAKERVFSEWIQNIANYTPFNHGE